MLYVSIEYSSNITLLSDFIQVVLLLKHLQINHKIATSSNALYTQTTLKNNLLLISSTIIAFTCIENLFHKNRKNRFRFFNEIRISKTNTLL